MAEPIKIMTLAEVKAYISSEPFVDVIEVDKYARIEARREAHKVANRRRALMRYHAKRAEMLASGYVPSPRGRKRNIVLD